MTSQDVALEVAELGVRFGGVQALDAISLSVARGECVGLIGSNGAGKTTLINCITGVCQPSAGTIRVFGKSLERLGPTDMVDLGIARTFQGAAAFQQVGALDMVLLGRHSFMTAGIFRFGTPFGWKSEEHAELAALAVAERLGVANHCRANTPIDQLPYGVRKVIDLGRALACEPRLLLLDEPGAGLSRAEKVRMSAAIQQVERESAITIVVIDHDIEFLKALCTRLIVLEAGTKIADGPFERVVELPIVVSAYLGSGDL